MKKKVSTLFLLSAVLLTGCSNIKDDMSSSNSTDPEIERIYEAYKENGGTLTYEEWLATIKGEKGEKGDKGDQGEKGSDGSSVLTGKGAPLADLGSEGDSYIDTDTFDFYVKTNGVWVKKGNIKGSDGEDGLNGSSGENGSDGVSVMSIAKTSTDGNVDTYTITYSDGSTSTFTVTNGADGEQGIQGEKGEDGHTPAITIGDNGNWFIDGVDSGISAKGAKGDKGDKGDSGVSIVNTYIDEDGHLICEMSDGTKKDAGKVKDTSKHTVNFYNQGGNRLLDTVQVMDGDKVSMPSKDKLKGYHVHYWSASEDESGDCDSGPYVPWSFSGNTVTCDLNLYLVGETIEYSIDYDFVDGAENQNPSIYTVEDTISFNNPSKAGYTFGGWYADSSFESEITNIPDGSTGDMTIYAKWSADLQELSVVSEDSSKGTAEIVSGEGHTDEKITINATPTEGYAFKGWYEGTELASKEETYTFAMPAKDVSLTAKFWTQDESLGVIPAFDSASNAVTYGLYPQTRVSDETLISSLNELTESESNGWYLYEGAYYAKKSANSSITSYTFSDGTEIVEGAEYWFKCDPIEWRILSSSDGTHSIVSSALLDAHDFNSSGSSRTIDGKTIYPNNYEYSDIRSWLNGDFYDTAFALNDSLIQTVTVDNSAATTDLSSDKNACSDTEDKAYLLSYQDYRNADCFPDNASRECKPTDWAKANMATYPGYEPRSEYYGNGDYWTRSPLLQMTHDVYFVDSRGSLSSQSYDAPLCCVRPAITIKVA